MESTPPIDLEEALDATEDYLDQMQERVGRARSALQDGEEREAWKAFREVVDDAGDLLALVVNDIRDIAPAKYFPSGMASILGVEQPSTPDPEEEDRIARKFDPHDYESQENLRLAVRAVSHNGVEQPSTPDPEEEDRIARKFDPHDYESQENLRLAVRAVSHNGGLDAVRLGFMFAPPENILGEFASKDDLQEGISRSIWSRCEGMTPGELEQETQAAERAVDNAAAHVIDYLKGRTDEPPSIPMLWLSAWKAEVLNQAMETATLPGMEIPSWEELTGDQKEKLRNWPESADELSEGARDVLRGVENWTDGRPKHLWPEHKKELYGYAGEEVERRGWGKENPERPQNTLENALRTNASSVPEDVEELVELARSTLNGR